MIFCLILTRLIFSSAPFFVSKNVVVQINSSNEQHYVVSNVECKFSFRTVTEGSKSDIVH